MVEEGQQRVAAIVLAGGVSKRMGVANKLHLSVHGKPLLRHCIETLSVANLGEIVVVLGHQHQDTGVMLEGLQVRTVYNDDYLSGQMTSVHCGLAALKQPDSGIMVALGDQPALRVDEINMLVEAYLNRSKGEVVIPEYRGQRGNPIIFSDQCRQDILSGKRNLGCRRFIENNPELVQVVEMNTPSVVIDIDTPEAYQRYCQQHD